MTPSETRSIKFPFPPWHDPSVQCEFHDGIVGHSIKECKFFKEEVQDPIDNKYLTYGKGLIMVKNPYPNERRDFRKHPVKLVDQMGKLILDVGDHLSLSAFLLAQHKKYSIISIT